MRTVLLASLRTHARRYVAALVAVTIAVGFVVVVNALASATKSGLSAGVADAYPGGDLVVGETYGVEPRAVERAEDVAGRHGDRTSVIALGRVPVATDAGLIGSDVSVSTVADDAVLRRQQVESGRAPRGEDEALVDADAARGADVSVGDTLTLDPGPRETTLRVVGLTSDASYLSADVYAPWTALADLPGAYPDSLVYDVRGGSVADRESELVAATGARVSTLDDYVDERVTLQNQGVDIVSYLLLLFATVAGFVAALVIANTFTILFAQRTRELALLRCVGATRRQVVRAVRRESVALAVVASTVGVVGGALAGHVIAAVVRGFAGADRVGAVALSPAWVIAAFVGGVLVTVAAAWLPTRSVVRISPLAALRPMGAVDVRDRAGRLRLLLGGLVVAVGGASLGVAVIDQQIGAMLAGGVLSFTGVLLLGPVIVPVLLSATGRLLARVGPSVRLAAANAGRNPRRTATTTASLLVGVTLATAVLTGMASARGAVDGLMDADHPADGVLLSSSTIKAGVVEDLEATTGVDRAAAVLGTRATVDGLGDTTVIAPRPADAAVTRDPQAVTAEADEVLVLAELAADLPARVAVRVGDDTVQLRPRQLSAEWGQAVVVAPSTLQQLGGPDGARAVWVRATDGTDADAFDADLQAVARDAGLDVTNALENRAYVDLQLDVAVWAVLGLLGVAVGIALVGIANTIGLSVLERGREHALLRALGLTRAQLRRVLAAEGLLVALVAATLGTAIGTTFGWIGTRTLVGAVVPDAPLVVPWADVAAVLAGAAAAGLLACVLPARRAARVSPAQGLTWD